MVDAALQRFLTDLEKRVTNLETDIRRADLPVLKSQAETLVKFLHPASTNMSNIREMFLLEVVRAKGLLDGIDLDSIEAKVRTKYAEKDIPWGAKQATAVRNIKRALREIPVDYHWKEDEDAPAA
ncbi:MAG: hypothetical protein E5W98_30610 [Mesorhizobium sp.]|uniref:hypothetical protein n=1 Tax=Mesorhizobium sp. TaxID=1871066 RepID=UPI0012010D9A|nr:hypothetical protein [Mesorhizobium sp.]TIT01037.1 MAG: hypothetical protein E5W87_16775 [Mesorhizobium sp.]TKD26587.1 MAG: hypothetical protein E5W98_30610 [Mesorhizobium sp.]